MALTFFRRIRNMDFNEIVTHVSITELQEKISVYTKQQVSKIQTAVISKLPDPIRLNRAIDVIVDCNSLNANYLHAQVIEEYVVVLEAIADACRKNGDELTYLF